MGHSIIKVTLVGDGSVRVYDLTFSLSFIVHIVSFVPEFGLVIVYAVTLLFAVIELSLIGALNVCIFSFEMR
jgi:hypothetical protein